MASLKGFVAEQPDAVYVRSYGYRTFEAIEDADGFTAGGQEIVADLLEEGEGAHHELLLKPNVVVGRPHSLRDDPAYHGGIVTNARFVAGMLDGLLACGERNITVVEGGTGQGVSGYAQNGYFDVLTERISRDPHPTTREHLGVRLQWTTKNRFSDYRDDELTWVPVPDGVVHRIFPIVSPFFRPGTIILNVPTLKTHNLGIVTLCCKALQGVVASGYRHFCWDLSHFDAGRRFKMPAEHLQPDLRERVQQQHRRHLAAGLPHWDSKPDPVYGTGRFECWAQRTADLLSLFRPYPHRFLLNVVEGIIGRNGTAFSQGSDVPAGLVVAGLNPVHVDAVAALLMGHDPRLLPHLVVCHERGLGENDPERIPIYRLPSREPLSPADLREMAVPLPVLLHGEPGRELYFTDDGRPMGSHHRADVV